MATTKLVFNPKGKQKATVPEDPWDTNPVVTYRHIVSNIPAVHNPLRVIALVDNDAFYASAERVRLGLPEDTAIAVQQWQALIAVSYKAREYGIKRMDTVTEAKKKCPQLIAVHTATYREGDTEPAYHENPDVSLEHYRLESKKIVDLYRELLPPGGQLERASIDECFFDLTQPIRDVLIQRYPHLSQMPPDAPLGVDTPLPPPPNIRIAWKDLGNLVPIQRSAAGPTDGTSSTGTEVKPLMEPSVSMGTTNNPDEDEEEHDLTWGDVALSIGAEMILNMRTQVKERLGYTTSGGIARNKVLAKLVASYRKRDTQAILRNAAIPGYWRPMPFQKIRFLGGKLGEHLSSAFEVQTVGELEHITLDEMQRKFGEESIWVWNVLRGVDYSELSEEVANKSMLASKNIRPPVVKWEDGDRWLRMLAGDLSLRLTEARELAPSMWPKTLTLGIKQDSDPRQSRQCPFPYTRNFSVDTIITLAQKLWRELTSGKQGHAKIHNISLSFHGLTSAEAGQKRIENFLASSSKRPRTDDADADADEVDGIAARPSFVCERCSKRISVPPDSFEIDIDGDVEPDSEGRSALALERLKIEHADYHFARDLAHQHSDPEDGHVEAMHRPASKKQKKKGNEPPSKASTKRKEPPRGIAKYFDRQPAGSSSSSRKK
ncbi:DNA polymerase eta [Clavulina sp. PMI_390]|nr:DNA polymerase eta [Clavulina sp. PMI_390]